MLLLKKSVLWYHENIRDSLLAAKEQLTRNFSRQYVLTSHRGRLRHSQRLVGFTTVRTGPEHETFWKQEPRGHIRCLGRAVLYRLYSLYIPVYNLLKLNYLRKNELGICGNILLEALQKAEVFQGSKPSKMYRFQATKLSI